MPLSAGTRLGPYEVVASIGAGGMGEVYRARDTRLNRDVALKILPDAFASDPLRIARFQREAHMLAALNHPYIAHIYGLEESGNIRALVMEYVDGAGLDDRIARGPLPFHEALTIARQIAEALEVAHEHGIVHRDLKPANVKVKDDGTVKVLDFGLAKALTGEASGADIANSPTITSPAMTEHGVILGTAAYMAPEQARGKPVDKRADIWAFGVLTAEMVTGRRMFQGDHVSDVLAAVMRDAPDLTGVPASLRRVLEKCLEKDPRKRLRDISSVPLMLDEQAAARATEGGSAKQAPWRHTAGLAALVVAAILVATVLAVALWLRPAEGARESVVFLLDPPAGTTLTNIQSGVAASPDGRHVILTAATAGGPTSLWLRRLDALEAERLPGTEGGTAPVFSPDGRSVAFIAEQKLKRVEIAGGTPVVLASVPCADPFQPVGWSPRGVIVWGCSRGLDSVAADGGEVTTLRKTDAALQETAYGFPQFLSDGRRFLYHVASGDPKVRGTYASSIDDPASRTLILNTADKAVYVPPHRGEVGYLLWAEGRTLTARPFDAEALELRGAPVAVAEAEGLDAAAALHAAFWASDGGLLVYAPAIPPADARRGLVVAARDGKVLGDVIPEGPYNAIALSRDQQRLAVTRMSIAGTSDANGDIWVWDFTRQTMSRVTFGPTTDENPVWSPDGRQMAFSSNRGGRFYQLYRKDASGAGDEERLTEADRNQDPLDWSPDGRFLVFRQQNPKTGWDLMLLPLVGDRTPITLLETPFSDSDARFSPDSRLIAFHSAMNGGKVPQVYVQAFSSEGKIGLVGSRLQVSGTSGISPLWRRDGREIVYRTVEGAAMAAAVQTVPELSVGRPRELFSPYPSNGMHTMDMTGDGERFFIVTNPRRLTQTPRLTVVTNWQARLVQ